MSYFKTSNGTFKFKMKTLSSCTHRDHPWGEGAQPNFPRWDYRRIGGMGAAPAKTLNFFGISFFFLPFPLLFFLLVSPQFFFSFPPFFFYFTPFFFSFPPFFFSSFSPSFSVPFLFFPILSSFLPPFRVLFSLFHYPRFSRSVGSIFLLYGSRGWMWALCSPAPHPRLLRLGSPYDRLFIATSTPKAKAFTRSCIS